MLEAIFELGDKFGHFLTLFALSRCQFGTPCRFLFICGMVFALIRRILIVQSENYATNKGKTTWGAKVTQTWGVIGCSKPNFSFIYSINLSIACNELMLKQEWENENIYLNICWHVCVRNVTLFIAKIEPKLVQSKLSREKGAFGAINA